MSHVDGGLLWSINATTSTTTTITGWGQEWRQKKRQMWQWQQKLQWGLGKVKKGRGSRCRHVSSTKYVFFYITNVYITDLHWYPTTEMAMKKAMRLGDEDRGLGGKGRGRSRGSRHICILSPRYVFFIWFLYYTNVYITDLHCYPTTVIKANGHGLKTATKKKDKDSNEEGDEVGRWGQRAGRQGQGQGQGLEMQTHLKPQVCFFSMFFRYSSNFFLQWNATWWKNGPRQESRRRAENQGNE